MQQRTATSSQSAASEMSLSAAVLAALQVTYKLSVEDVTSHTAVGVSWVSHILHLMSNTAFINITKAAEEGLSPSDSGDAQLDDIITATTWRDEKAAEQVIYSNATR